MSVVSSLPGLVPRWAVATLRGARVASRLGTVTSWRRVPARVADASWTSFYCVELSSSSARRRRRLVTARRTPTYRTRQKGNPRRILANFCWNKLCGRPPQYAPAPVTLNFDLESDVRVTCDVGYLCANFSLPRPPCSRLRPDVCDRQTDRQDVRHMSDSIIA